MGMQKGTIFGEKAEREPASDQERVEYVIDIVDDLMD